MKYKIQFFDFWHLGSGVSAGPSLDALVLKDELGLPYLSGKTIKGLVREMLELLDEDKAKEIFGQEGANIANSYFTNATLDLGTKKHLQHKQHLIKHLFSKVTSTKIGSNGIAEDKTLREIEVVKPLILVGEIKCSDEDIIIKALQMIKQIGLNRNRGLGRCEISEVKDDK